VREKSEPEARAPRGAVFAFASGAVFLASFLYRLRAVEGKFLWFDEFLSANLARRPWGGLLDAVHREAHPPLYFVLLKIWSLAFGDGRVAMKMLSLAAGMAALLLVADAARAAWGPAEGLLTAVLFGLSTVQIDQATDAKPYAVLAMFLGLLVWCLARIGQGDVGAAAFLGALLAAAAAASTHFYGGVAAVLCGLAAVLAFRARRERRRAAAVLAVSVLALAFWLPPALRLPRGAADYIREIWARVPSWAPLAVSTRISLPGWRKPYPAMTGRVLPELSGWEVAAALIFGGLILAGWISGRRAEEGKGGGRRFLLLSGLALFFGFLALETLGNVLDRPIGLPGRAEIVTQTGLAFLAAAALSRVARGRGVCIAALAAVGLATAAPQWRRLSGPLPARREEVIVRALEGEAPARGFAEIVTLGLARPPFDYYAAGDPRLRLVSFPASQDDHPGWRTDGEVVFRRPELEREAEDLAARLDEDLLRGVQVYVAAREDPRNAILLSRLKKDHDLAPTRFAEWFLRLEKAPVRVAAKLAS
jgi:hypothetical protein